MRKQILIMLVGIVLLISVAYAGISLTSEKEVVLDKEVIDNIKELGFSLNYELSPCVKVDDVYCKFIANNNPYFFEDYMPHLAYIEYKGKTTEQINEEMKKNVEEMLKFYSDKLNWEKSIVEEEDVFVSDKVVVSVKENEGEVEK